MNSKLLFSLGKIAIINFFVVIALFLLTMFPRGTNQTDIQQFSIKYYFSINSYFENIKNYFMSRYERKDLGVTWIERTPVLEEMKPFVLNSVNLFLTTLLISILVSVVVSLILHKLLLKYKRLDLKKFPSWFELHDIFIIVILYSFISYFSSNYSFGQIAFLSIVYPSMVMTKFILVSLSTKTNLSFVQMIKTGFITILLRFRSFTLLLLTSVFLVEWLTKYKGFTSLFISKVDFSTGKFARSFRTYDYELIIVMMLALILLVIVAEWISFITRKITRNEKSSWIKTIRFLWISHGLIVFAIIALVLFPKSGFQDYTNIAYTFSPTDYKNNITSLLSSMVYDKSLGETKSGASIESEVFKLFPRSLKIIIAAFFITIIVGLMKGIVDYRIQKKWYGMIGKAATWATVSTPDFFIMFFIQWFLIFNVPTFKVLGHEHWYSFLFLGALISIHPIAYVANIVRNALDDEAGEMYVQVALSKGLSRNYILKKHMLKNVIPTLCSYLSAVLLYIMSNLLIVEWFFDYSGAVQRMLMAINISTNLISVKGSFETEDAPLLFGILVCFLLPLIAAQIVGTMIKYKFHPVGRD